MPARCVKELPEAEEAIANLAKATAAAATYFITKTLEIFKSFNVEAVFKRYFLMVGEKIFYRGQNLS